MEFDLKSSLMLKTDKSGNAILFSAEDKSDKYIKVNSIALLVVEKLLKNIPIEEIKKNILSEYDVTDEVLAADLRTLYERLKEAGFIASKK